MYVVQLAGSQFHKPVGKEWLHVCIVWMEHKQMCWGSVQEQAHTTSNTAY